MKKNKFIGNYKEIFVLIKGVLYVKISNTTSFCLSCMYASRQPDEHLMAVKSLSTRSGSSAGFLKAKRGEVAMLL